MRRLSIADIFRGELHNVVETSRLSNTGSHEHEEIGEWDFSFSTDGTSANHTIDTISSTEMQIAQSVISAQPYLAILLPIDADDESAGLATEGNMITEMATSNDLPPSSDTRVSQMFDSPGDGGEISQQSPGAQEIPGRYHSSEDDLAATGEEPNDSMPGVNSYLSDNSRMSSADHVTHASTRSSRRGSPRSNPRIPALPLEDLDHASESSASSESPSLHNLLLTQSRLASPSFEVASTSAGLGSSDLPDPRARQELGRSSSRSTLRSEAGSISSGFGDSADRPSTPQVEHTTCEQPGDLDLDNRPTIRPEHSSVADLSWLENTTFEVDSENNPCRSPLARSETVQSPLLLQEVDNGVTASPSTSESESQNFILSPLLLRSFSPDGHWMRGVITPQFDDISDNDTSNPHSQTDDHSTLDGPSTQPELNQGRDENGDDPGLSADSDSDVADLDNNMPFTPTPFTPLPALAFPTSSLEDDWEQSLLSLSNDSIMPPTAGKEFPRPSKRPSRHIRERSESVDQERMFWFPTKNDISHDHILLKSSMSTRSQTKRGRGKRVRIASDPGVTHPPSESPNRASGERVISRRARSRSEVLPIPDPTRKSSTRAALVSEEPKRKSLWGKLKHFFADRDETRTLGVDVGRVDVDRLFCPFIPDSPLDNEFIL